MSAKTRQKVEELLKRGLPDKHPLDFYKVLGRIKGLYMVLHEDEAVAERRAIEVLDACRPDRRTALSVRGPSSEEQR